MTEPGLIPPHGGTLVNRLVSGAERESALARAGRLPAIPVDPYVQSDIEVIAVGALSPLLGFMTELEVTSVLARKRLPNGVVWTLPVTLAVPEAQAKGLAVGRDVALTDESGTPLAILTVRDLYRYDKAAYAQGAFGTTDRSHPGVARLFEQGEVFLGGPLAVINLPAHDDFSAQRLTPAQTRAEFSRRGWQRVVGFQTRNPIHRAHEYLLKVALEVTDGLLIHPLVGETKLDDVPAAVRMRCYEVLIEKYFPKDRVLLAVNPCSMRYAGPREAIFHAILRKNYGCTHFIVGRDHAGVGSFYGPFDAQEIFTEFEPEALGITPLFFDSAFYCKACGGMASTKSCPHGAEQRVLLSGTAVRALLKEGKLPPPEFSRPEVAQILIEALAPPLRNPGHPPRMTSNGARRSDGPCAFGAEERPGPLRDSGGAG